jgi:hypothetical protein
MLMPTYPVPATAMFIGEWLLVIETPLWLPRGGGFVNGLWVIENKD